MADSWTTALASQPRTKPAASSDARGAVLVASPDPRLATALRTGLTAHSFTVSTVADGLSALHCATTRSFDVVVLDPALPKLPGLEVLRRLRDLGAAVPVVMLSTHMSVPDSARTAVLHADAYVPKPVRFEKLLSAVRSLMPSTCEPAELLYGGLRLDLNTRHAHVGDYSVRLSEREFALAVTFIKHPGQFLTRQYLLDQVWGGDRVHASNVVDVYVGQLRKKLGLRRITAQRGVGYRLEATA